MQNVKNGELTRLGARQGRPHVIEGLHRRQALRQGRRQDQRLRPRPALRRRRVRGHAQLRRQGLPPGGAPRAALGLGQGHLAQDSHQPGADGRRRSTTRSRPTASRTATSASSSRAAPARWGSTPTAAADPQVIIITDHIALYPGRDLREGPGDRHRQHDPQPPGGPQPADQVAQLPQQHPGQDRRAAGRLRRSPDAQPKGEVAECTGDNIFIVEGRRAAARRRSTPASWKASRATP